MKNLFFFILLLSFVSCTSKNEKPCDAKMTHYLIIYLHVSGREIEKNIILSSPVTDYRCGTYGDTYRGYVEHGCNEEFIINGCTDFILIKQN